jgi:predicted nucleotidyltransferase
MDQETNIAIENFLHLIRERYADFEKAFLFGSYSTGNATQDSDIDLALIFKNLDDSKRFDTQVQLMLLAAKIDTRIEPHPISHDDFYSGNPFVIEIQRTGVEYGS